MSVTVSPTAETYSGTRCKSTNVGELVTTGNLSRNQSPRTLCALAHNTQCQFCPRHVFLRGLVLVHILVLLCILDRLGDTPEMLASTNRNKVLAKQEEFEKTAPSHNVSR